MMLPDERCPECHGPPRVLLVARDSLVKQCEDCRHTWHEEIDYPAVRFVGRGGWVRFREDKRRR